MKEMYLKFQAMPKNIVVVVAIVFLVFEATFIFPLRNNLSLIYVVMVYGYFMIGLALCATQAIKPWIMLTEIIGCNLLGLGLRILLEWGQVTISRDLTSQNILFTYIPIIIITFAGYMYANIVIQSKLIDT